MTDKNIEMTNVFTSFGGSKLLQHTDVLNMIQTHKHFDPIMVELCPTEICDSDCPFCSVAGRPIKSVMPWEKVTKVLDSFAELGAKSLEITGGGNPILYQDKEKKKNINDIIEYAHNLGSAIGLITNSHNLKTLYPRVFPFIN